MPSLPCPHCGDRDIGEFHYGGDASKTRPARVIDDRGWAQYRFFRKNEKGRAQELWCHAGGCGGWIIVERDTLTHTVKAAKEAVP